MLKQQKKHISINSLFIILVLFICFISSKPIEAYVPFTAASSINIQGSKPIGAVVSFEDNSYRLSDKPYDSKIVGIIVSQADIIVESESETLGDILMINRGDAEILVNGESGTISSGDLLTSSSVPGQAMKAEKDGIVIAVALESFSPTESTDNATIRALVDVRFTTVGDTFSADSLGLSEEGMVSTFRRSVSELIGLGTSGLSGTSPIFRYTLATLIVSIAFISGFMLFGRIALRGVEALGRNPLANKTILVGIIINALFTILLISFALFLAYIIIIA